MKREIYIWIIWIIFGGLFSCQEQVDWELSPRSTELIVVDGIFTNERINHLVKISRTNLNSNDGWTPVSGAVVAITDGADLRVLTEFPAGSGFYYTASNVQAVFGKTYALIIQWEGQAYFGGDRAEPVEPLGPLNYGPAGDLYTLHFPEGNGPSMTKYFMSWEQTNYCQVSGTICFAKVVDYDLKTIDVNELFKPDKEKVLFPAGTVVLRKKYSVSNSYRNYLRGLLSETEWRGGQFDVARGNVVTNMSEGAIGYFAVSMAVTDTTSITPLQ